MNAPPAIPRLIYLLALTIFALTTAEFMVAGMMPTLAADLGVSIGQIGYLISWYALGMALGGPPLTLLLLALRLAEKSALLWLLSLYLVGAVVAALAANYPVMAAGRVLMGVASSASIGLCLTLGANLVTPDRRGRAASLILSGLMLAPVFGVPGTVLIEQQAGWRASFWAVALLAACCTLLVGLCVPRTPARAAGQLRGELDTLVSARLWAAYLTSGLIIGATFAGFSYFSPILIQVTGFAPTTIPWLLMGYGLANVLGNLLVGRLADRHTLRVQGVGLAVLALGFALFVGCADSAAPSLLALALIGLTGVALNPAMVARVMAAATPGPLVNTLHTSVITAGLAVGAWAGGAAIDAGQGLRAPLWVGLGMALLGLLSLLPLGLRRDAAIAARPRAE